MALTSHAEAEILQITIEAEQGSKVAGPQGGQDELDSGEDNDNNDQQQLNTEMMEVTPEHPIYVEGKGWIWAENLAIGDTLRRADGGTAKVLAIERVELAAPELVYNFTVEGPHTYFAVGVLVHNCGGGDADDIIDARLDNLEFIGPQRKFTPEQSTNVLSQRLREQRNLNPDLALKQPNNFDDIISIAYTP